MSNSVLTIKCFMCGKTGNLAPTSDSVFSASMLKVDGKTGCLCMECLKKLYEANRPFMSNNSAKKGIISKIVAEGPKKKEQTSKQSDDLVSLVNKWKCLDYSLESYIKLAEKKVFGQSNAVKRTIFSLYSNQYFNLIDDYGYPAPARKQVFMIGPTGVGKSYTAMVAAKMMHIPYARSNAEAITSAGYIGDKVEAILERLLKNADDDLEAAQEGIIIIDEIDKKAVRQSEGDKRDINGLAVQQELLKILEPSDVWINHHSIKFDTSHLTVVLCGAFVGLEDIIRERLYPRKIGFAEEHDEGEDLLLKVENCDLEKYGFIPEFLGRTPYPIVLQPLSYETITDIIYEKLSEENVLFKVKGVDLSVDPYAIKKLAYHIMSQKTGARAVKKELDEFLYPAEFLLLCSPPNGSCEIDEYGTATFLHGDKNTKKCVVDQLPTTLEYMLKDLPEDEDDDEFISQETSSEKQCFIEN